MVEVERATWEISCRNCDRTKPGEVIPESPPNGFLISRAVPSFGPQKSCQKWNIAAGLCLHRGILTVPIFVVRVAAHHHRLIHRQASGCRVFNPESGRLGQARETPCHHELRIRDHRRVLLRRPLFSVLLRNDEALAHGNRRPRTLRPFRSTRRWKRHYQHIVRFCRCSQAKRQRAFAV